MRFGAVMTTAPAGTREWQDRVRDLCDDVRAVRRRTGGGPGRRSLTIREIFYPGEIGRARRSDEFRVAAGSVPAVADAHRQEEGHADSTGNRPVGRRDRDRL
jgi:hypothetical protein